MVVEVRGLDGDDGLECVREGGGVEAVGRASNVWSMRSCVTGGGADFSRSAILDSSLSDDDDDEDHECMLTLL